MMQISLYNNLFEVIQKDDKSITLNRNGKYYKDITKEEFNKYFKDLNDFIEQLEDKIQDHYDRWFKIETRGNTYVTALFFNPITHKCKSMVIYDYDNPYVSDEAGEYYSMPITTDEFVIKQYHKEIQYIGVGTIIKIVKGRKMLGEVKKIVKTFTYKPKNAPSYCDWYNVEYAVFEDGTKVNIENCEYVNID